MRFERQENMDKFHNLLESGTAKHSIDSLNENMDTKDSNDFKNHENENNVDNIFKSSFGIRTGTLESNGEHGIPRKNLPKTKPRQGNTIICGICLEPLHSLSTFRRKKHQLACEKRQFQGETPLISGIGKLSGVSTILQSKKDTPTSNKRGRPRRNQGKNKDSNGYVEREISESLNDSNEEFSSGDNNEIDSKKPKRKRKRSPADPVLISNRKKKTRKDPVYDTYYDSDSQRSLDVLLEPFVNNHIPQNSLRFVDQDVNNVNKKSNPINENGKKEGIEDVQSWLSNLGLNEYIPNFILNGYDTLTVCASLNQDDFAKDGLNIVKKGHQKLLLLEAKLLRKSIMESEKLIGKKKRKLVIKNASILESPNRRVKNRPSDSTSEKSLAARNTPKSTRKQSKKAKKSKAIEESNESNISETPSKNLEDEEEDIVLRAKRSTKRISETDLNRYAPIYDLKNRKSPSQMEQQIIEAEIGDIDEADSVEERFEINTPRLNISMTPKSKSGHSLFRMSRLTPSQELNKKVIQLTPPESVSRRLLFSPSNQDEDDSGMHASPNLSSIIDLQDSEDESESNQESYPNEDCELSQKSISNEVSKEQIIQPIIIELDGNDNEKTDLDKSERDSSIIADSILFEHLPGSTPCTKRTTILETSVVTSNLIQVSSPDSRVTPSPKRDHCTPSSKNNEDKNMDSIRSTAYSINSRDAKSPINFTNHTNKVTNFSASDESMIQEIQAKYKEKCKHSIDNFYTTLQQLFNQLKLEVNQLTEDRDRSADEISLFYSLPSLQLDSIEDTIRWARNPSTILEDDIFIENTSMTTTTSSGSTIAPYAKNHSSQTRDAVPSSPKQHEFQQNQKISIPPNPPNLPTIKSSQATQLPLNYAYSSSHQNFLSGNPFFNQEGKKIWDKQ